MFFKDRYHAGQLLASRLQQYKDTPSIVLALPKGGVPVGAQIAQSLGIPLEIIVVRKIGSPLNPELALGAVCETEAPVLNESILGQMAIAPGELNDIIETERNEIRRQIQKFRSGMVLGPLNGKTAIVVDDGLATGAAVIAALKYLNGAGVTKAVVAVPIAAAGSANKVRALADRFVDVEEIENLLAVGHWYENFDPVSDEEVLSLKKSIKLSMQESPFMPKAISKTLDGGSRNAT